MKLNALGLIAAILAFISIVLPWYSITSSYGGINYSLLDFIQAITVPWYIWGALALVVIGGLLGLFGSFIIGRNGKNLLVVAGILVILSPIIFAGGYASEGAQLFGSVYGITYFLSAGFFLALIAGILLFISTKKHPMEAAVAPLAPAAPTPPPPR